MLIKRAIMITFDPISYTANILLLEATNAAISGVPVACHMDGTSGQRNTLCAVLFFDALNYSDAVVLATYPNGTQGIPTPPPGRCVFIPGYRHVLNLSIAAGVTNIITVAGSASGIPVGVKGVMYKLFFSSPTVGAYVQLAPHGATDINAYAAFGNIQITNASIQGTGIVGVDTSGRVDIKANGGTCNVTLYTYGYVY